MYQVSILNKNCSITDSRTRDSKTFAEERIKVIKMNLCIIINKLYIILK